MTLKTVSASLLKVSLIVLLLFSLEGCVQKGITSTSSTYEEDLSIHRPPVEAYVSPKTTDETEEGVENIQYPSPSNHIQSEINQIVDKTIEYNKSKRYLNGFAIQVYSGLESKEKDQAELKVYSMNLEPRTTFTQPVWKVKVGRFYTRLEATKFLNEVKAKIPTALIVFEKIRIN